MLMNSFSLAQANSLNSPVSLDMPISSMDCGSAMNHHDQMMKQTQTPQMEMGDQCPSDNHAAKECCSSTCLVNIGADIHSFSIVLIQPSRRLNQVGELSFLLPFQASSLFRPPRV
jgi:hypothetical protein